MRLLVLGGTSFLGRHVAAAALARGHDVATLTRGVTGAPPEGARDLHGDRDDPGALPRALGEWAPELVVDTSCQTRAAARNAAAVLGGVGAYVFVSSLNAYRNWPPGPVGPEAGEPTWDTEDDEYGPIRRPPSGSSPQRSGASAGGWSASPGAGGSSSRPRAWPSRSRWSTPATWRRGWWRWPSRAAPAPSTPPARPA
ncbi:NAD-dependent epimerase/dehydratase family protein [Blastococcus sp. VKM Ac-2987]|uniref:NAD-dependent epimerase/dehydratase family protein n=1 Tax=Blastococcus sp. VKM Ac-2987 TaxID=3004141 RepID=UPI0022AB9ADC|nr:NAD-dependent epimerase/dehydratase family protein [Blastococcus sp. VKM Ac-2987]MCZ2857762.1 NAD-dependent epimerase/dehydratase family protein [Blastococcus sp. VKM Ac-2987]